MKGRFPRTPAEFEAHHRQLVLQCSCGAPTSRIGAKSLIQRLGPDFDLYDGFDEARAAFPCETCGKLQELSFRNLRPRPAFEPVPFEEALTDALELRAFARARDKGAPGGLRAEQGAGGTRRRFGSPWGRRH